MKVRQQAEKKAEAEKKAQHRKMHEEIHQRDAANFAKLCELARAKNEDGIKELLKGMYIDQSEHMFVYDNKPAVTIMAEEGRDDAVKFLIEKFDASPGKAAQGYARTGRVEKVEELARQHKVMDILDHALRGYATADDLKTAEIENLLKRGAHINMAAYGHARRGRVEQVNAMLDRGANIAIVLEGFAQSGNFEQVDAFIKRETKEDKAAMEKGFLSKLKSKMTDHASPPCYSAEAGYVAAGYFEDENKFQELLANTKDDSIRQHHLKFAKEHKRSMEENFEHSIDEIEQKAAGLRKLMKDKNLSYADALKQPEPAPAPVPVKAEATPVRRDSHAALFAAAKSHTKEPAAAEAPKPVAPKQ